MLPDIKKLEVSLYSLSIAVLMKIEQLKTTNITSFTVSNGQESKNN